MNNIQVKRILSGLKPVVAAGLVLFLFANFRFKKKVSGFSKDALTLFENYAWPGNVRQLRHEVERLVARHGNTSDGH